MPPQHGTVVITLATESSMKYTFNEMLTHRKDQCKLKSHMSSPWN